MHDSIPTNPAPTAVPWTPNMVAAPAPEMPLAPVAPPAQPQPPYTAAPQYQPPQPLAPQAMSPQPISAQPNSQQRMQAYAPQPQAYAQAQPMQAAPLGQQAHIPQPAPTPHMAHPQAAPMQAPHVQQPQLQTPQVHYPQGPQDRHAQPPHGQYAPAMAPQHFPQAAIPPLVAPHLQTAAEAVKAPSKGFISNLLKRSPKPDLPALAEGTAPKVSGSLFNKNFGLGAVAGLVIGAFVLPMLVNLVGGGDAAAQNQAFATSNVTETTASGDTFIDQAISTETP